MSLTLIAPAGRNKFGHITWTCQCSCGNQSVHVGFLVRSGKVKSCGCKRQGPRHTDSTLKFVYRDYQDRAKKKTLEFSLNFDQFKKISQSNCVYCGSEPSIRNRKGKVLINGVDRRDNDKGYTEENCVSCCSICNIAKNDLAEAEFREWIARLVGFNK